MFEHAHNIRKAYIDALAALQVDAITVPVYDEFLRGTPPIIREAKCYVIVRDQQSVEVTNTKCGQKQECFITLDVVTVFPKNKGGKLLSELISNGILQLVNVFRGQLQIAGGYNVRTRKQLSVSIIEDTVINSTFRNVLTFSNLIT
ncbi:MAG TPA: hypothetical protein VD907_06650 [Verrucomicrobiae bacterium]|nr:hypothetical protein [Verrucomicrobiae bacterium]